MTRLRRMESLLLILAGLARMGIRIRRTEERNCVAWRGHDTERFYAHRRLILMPMALLRAMTTAGWAPTIVVPRRAAEARGAPPGRNGAA
jgi:hypothetical protein